VGRKEKLQTMETGFVVTSASPLRRARAAAQCTRSRRRGRCVTMEAEPNVVGGVLVALFGTAVGVGALVWAEKQGERGAERENLQPCVECNGAGKIVCEICRGSGLDPVFGETEGEECKFCEGVKMTTCLNCNGGGIQPRFLDRLSPEDFMD